MRSPTSSTPSPSPRTWRHRYLGNPERASELLSRFVRSEAMDELRIRCSEFAGDRASFGPGPGCRGPNSLEFPRFRGHLTAEPSGRPGRMSVDAEDSAVFVGVPS
jgi:hypothetical protein